MNRGAVAHARPWSEDEKAIVRDRYPREGAQALAAELGRTLASIRHAAIRLGAPRSRPWTARDDDALRLSWGELPLPALARKLGRTEAAVYVRARQLRIECGAPQGYEYLSHAAERTGYAVRTLRRILRWSGVRLRPTMSRPGRARRSYHCVDPYEVDRAVERWLSTETIEGAARRQGWSNEAITRWLAEAGKLPPSRGHKKHLRVEKAVVDEVVAARMRANERPTLADHAHRLGIGRGTLARWLVDSGVPRPQRRPWFVDAATVERVASERLRRPSCRARKTASREAPGVEPVGDR